MLWNLWILYVEKNDYSFEALALLVALPHFRNRITWTNYVTIFSHATKKHNENIIKLLSFQTSEDKIRGKKLESILENIDKIEYKESKYMKKVF